MRLQSEEELEFATVNLETPFKFPTRSRRDTSSVLIDVREPAEFKEFHLPGAVNLPSSASIEAYERFADRHMMLVCESGSRARDVAAKLEIRGYAAVTVSPINMSTLRQPEVSPVGVAGSWTLDRQLRLVLGMVLLSGLSAAILGFTAGLALIAVVGVGLTVTSIIDRCYLMMVIARLPWNRATG